MCPETRRLLSCESYASVVLDLPVLCISYLYVLCCISSENGTTLLYYTANPCPKGWGMSETCIAIARADNWKVQ